jgi:formylmethanofuran dehydrogenase subunit C
MSGGTVIVTGRAGAQAGDRMRRGVIAIGGDAGPSPGSRMIAGLLAVFGNCGERPGALMRRGTIVLGGEVENLPPTFVETGPVELVLLHLLATELKDALPPSHLAPLKGRVRKWSGDMAVLGKGEILRLAV